MTGLAVLGTQWGDEGKGKLVDFLAEPAKAIVRFQGGDNAGHTVKVGDEIFKLHLLPSGILRKSKLAIIGNGVIVNPKVLLGEIEELESRGVSCSNLKISDRAHIIMPYHILLDGAEERLRAGKNVGTTGRGIGPCYSDKVSRIGLRMADLVDEQTFREKLKFAVDLKNRVLRAYDMQECQSFATIAKEYIEYGKRLSRYITDTKAILRDLVEKDSKILFEGAQGCLLDVDYGTYPYVTASNTIAGNIANGSGVPPSAINAIIGIAKAYTTRVGSGPFPTELPEKEGVALAKAGGEFGTTTGRMRRCGWLDLVVVSHAVNLSGINSIGLTKMDVLGDMDELMVCDHYKLNGKKTRDFPASLKELSMCEPAYTKLKGWGEVSESMIASLKKKGRSSLPAEMKAYISHIEKSLGIPVSAIGLGKERDRTIVLRDIWPK
jgi:adenylosuccinate synthase